VLEELEIGYQLVSRNRGEGRITYSDVDEALVESTPLLINTTPLGMHPDTDSCPDIPYTAISEGHLLFDLIYNPERTLFLEKGRENGAEVVNGYDMLVYQAEASWEIWNRAAENMEMTESGQG
jgi:shikimate dehydrogenase